MEEGRTDTSGGARAEEGRVHGLACRRARSQGKGGGGRWRRWRGRSGGNEAGEMSQGWRPCAGEGCRYFPGDMSRFTHTGDNHSPSDAKEYIAGAFEIGANALLQSSHGSGFHANGTLR